MLYEDFFNSMQFKHYSHPVRKRIETTEWHQVDISIRATAIRFVVCLQTIRRWIAPMVAMRGLDAIVKSSFLKIHPDRQVSYLISDRALFDWFLLERSAGRASSNLNLKHEMRHLVGDPSFKASDCRIQGTITSQLKHRMEEMPQG
jgi:hypothetical protein